MPRTTSKNERAKTPKQLLRYATDLHHENFDHERLNLRSAASRSTSVS